MLSKAIFLFFEARNRKNPIFLSSNINKLSNEYNAENYCGQWVLGVKIQSWKRKNVDRRSFRQNFGEIQQVIDFRSTEHNFS